MTVEDLRLLADHHDALAQAATQGPWVADDCGNIRDKPTEIVAYCHIRDGDVNKHLIAANDPIATLARVERDRLLADWIAAYDSRTDDGQFAARMTQLRERFTTLGFD